MDNGSSVRCGVVGLGNIGHKHADIIQQTEQTHLVGGADITEEARVRFSDTYDISAFESCEALIEAGVDALVIGTPNKYHVDPVLTAFEHDVPVLCEKPLAHTLDSAERIVEAEQDSDAFGMMGFNNRFKFPAMKAVEARDNGRFGDLTHIDAHYIRRRGIPGRGRWFTQKDLSGGGSLIDIGVHALDLALHLADQPTITEVLGVTRSQFGDRDDYVYETMYGEDRGPEEFDVDDSVTALLRCASGLTINLDVAWAANRSPSKSFTLRGTEGGASFALDDSDITFYDVNRDPDADESLPTVTTESDGHESYHREHEMFAQSVEDGTPPRWNTFDQALRVQRVIDAVYQSSERGQAVSLN